jgi:hypothetical protein
LHLFNPFKSVNHNKDSIPIIGYIISEYYVSFQAGYLGLPGATCDRHQWAFHLWWILPVIMLKHSLKV